MRPYISEFYSSLKKGKKTLKIYFKDIVYTQDDILLNIYKYSVVLKAKGIKKNTNVALISKKNPYFIFSLFALLSLGAVPVLIDRSLNRQSIKSLLKNTSFLISDFKVDYNKTLIMLSDMENTVKGVTSDQLAIIQNYFIKNTEKDRTVMILHTSGTTGNPKKVLYSEKNIHWVVREYFLIYHLNELTTIAFNLPVHYCLSTIASCVVPMLYKKEIVLVDEKDLEELLISIAKYKINILIALPIMYKYLLKMNLEKYDFSSLKICDSGGEILPLPIIKKFKKESGVTITEGYGQTETMSLTHFLIPDSSGNIRMGSIGKPCRNVKCKVVNEKSKKVEKGKLGELWLKGPMVMKGYSSKKENEKAFTVDGWFKTGDIVYQDSDNYYYLYSRKNDLGNNAYSHKAEIYRKIEDYIYTHEKIIEVATVIKNNNDINLFIKVVSLTEEEISILFKKISEDLSKMFHENINIKFVSFLPRTASGKIKKSLLN
jgi:long-chain acyl-CoA synthetase